ncbi:hypothetical protein WG70_25565 [Burkholderia oklahomensis EO147]|nr:hypothetical protein WG70_25565 [Burkholderia oklahomensis EO147]
MSRVVEASDAGLIGALDALRSGTLQAVAARIRRGAICRGNPFRDALDIPKRERGSQADRIASMRRSVNGKTANGERK